MSYFDLGNPAPTQLVARQGYGAVDGILSTIGGALKDAAKGVISIYGDSKTAAGQAQAATTIATAAVQQPARSGMPSWVLPVAAVGGLGLVALLVLKPKGRRNPARKRLRRRTAAQKAAAQKAWRRSRIADRDRHFRMIEDTLGIRRGSRQAWDPR